MSIKFLNLLSELLVLSYQGLDVALHFCLTLVPCSKVDLKVFHLLLQLSNMTSLLFVATRELAKDFKVLQSRQVLVSFVLPLLALLLKQLLVDIEITVLDLVPLLRIQLP